MVIDKNIINIIYYIYTVEDFKVDDNLHQYKPSLRFELKTFTLLR